MGPYCDPRSEWWMQPVGGDREAIAAFKAAIDVPIAVGEREWSVAGYRHWLETGAADILGIDPARAEGITGFRNAARVIEAAASARLFELKPLPGPMQFDLVDDPIWHDGGWVKAPAGPGHGVEPRPEVIDRYRVDLS